MKKITLKRLAFTLIELLVVIVIIGILATLATIALNSTRVKARDAKRVSDVKQMQTALELYFSDEQRYPTTGSWTTGLPLVGPTSGKTYMAKMPSNPAPRNDGDCDGSDYSYLGNATRYTINVCLGNNTSDLVAGYNFLNNGGWNHGFAVLVVDAPIVNLDGVRGTTAFTTDSLGSFTCTNNADVTFSVGNVLVGQINCNSVKKDKIVFLPELINKPRSATTDPEVTALSRFLWSLNTDVTSSTITIDPARKAQVIANASTNVGNSHWGEGNPVVQQLSSTNLSQALFSFSSIYPANTAQTLLAATYAIIGDGEAGSTPPPPACTPNCSGKVCGSDGCNGTCAPNSCSGATPVCKGDQSSCVACTVNAECAGTPSTPNCVNNTCVVCSADADCGTCQKCSSGTCANEANTEDTKDECSPFDCTNTLKGFSSNICQKYASATSANGNCDGNGACIAPSAACTGAATHQTCPSANCNNTCPAGSLTSAYPNLADVCYDDSQQHSCTSGQKCVAGACVTCSSNADCSTCQKCVSGSCTNQSAGEDLKAECAGNAITCSNFISGWNSLTCQKYSANTAGNGKCNGSGACTTGYAAACSTPVTSGTAVCGSAGCQRPAPACGNGTAVTGNDTVAEVCYTDAAQHACSAGAACDASGTCVSSCPATVTYNSITYNIVGINGQCWFKENLATILKPNSTGLSHGTGGEYLCPPNTGNTAEDCASATNGSNTSILGNIYTWAAAMNLASTCNSTNCSGSITTPHRGICPSGWHIPTDTEYASMINYAQDIAVPTTGSTCATAGNCANAGKVTKEAGTSYWTSAGGSPNNSLGLTIRGAGAYAGGWLGRGANAYLWSASQGSATYAWIRYWDYSNADANRNYVDKAYFFSVRCLKD